MNWLLHVFIIYITGPNNWINKYRSGLVLDSLFIVETWKLILVTPINNLSYFKICKIKTCYRSERSIEEVTRQRQMTTQLKSLYTTRVIVFFQLRGLSVLLFLASELSVVLSSFQLGLEF
uniref:Uncharacterized protein n=1 Tax=Rhizophagus irregularis (strain DAOM 181602 / DAOM 197198 / MUCL 43194) TaxID=747089 RepID=U9ULG1_RHIID